MMRVAIAISLFTLACSSSSSDTTEPRVPTLEVTSPERGTFSEELTVTVTGQVSDDGPVRISVNGTEVAPEADGSFSVTVALPPGLTVLETHALDDDGNDVRDVRAVLSGAVELSDGSLAAPIGAHADAAALAKVGDALAETAEGINFDAAVKAMNPVFEDGGCLGARVDVTSVALSGIDVDLTPVSGALDTRVAIHDVVVKAKANYKAACIGGSTNITVRTTRARIAGDLGVRVSSGKLATSLPSPTVALDGFSIDVGGVPGAVEDLLRTRVRDAVADALQKVIRDRVPGLADQALAGLLAKPVSLDLLGRPTSVEVVPAELTLTSGGLFVAVDSTIVVEGGEGGMFVATPAEVSSALMDGGGLGIALADDLPNQLFAGLWASGALDLSVTIDQIGPAATLFDDDVRTIDVRLSFPPAVGAAGGSLELAIGDVILTGRDDAGNEVQTLALTARTTLVAEPSSSGTIALALGQPELFAQVIAESDAVDLPLDAERVEGIIGGAWGLIGQLANDALATLPMPKVAGIELGTPSLAGRDGFVVASVPLN